MYALNGICLQGTSNSMVTLTLFSFTRPWDNFMVHVGGELCEVFAGRVMFGFGVNPIME